jgi:hypothetical protein
MKYKLIYKMPGVDTRKDEKILQFLTFCRLDTTQGY